MNNLRKYCLEALESSNFDCVAVGVVDFSKNSFDYVQETANEAFENERLFFDLASMTKPLTFAIAHLLKSKEFSSDMNLLIHHKGGIIPWGRLSHDTWKQQISSYEIKEADTVYSDFGALRLQIEIEKKLGVKLYDLVSPLWDKDIIHWKDLTNQVCPFTGLRNRVMISGQVHDDNAFVINEKVSHAGLFSTVQGVCQTLLNLNNEQDLLAKVGVDHEGRYIFGWDSVENPETSLAGSNCSKNTFGHLGFTGTSMWIDPVKKLGHVILTNEVLGHWYDREHLREFRKKIGSFVFR